MVWIDAPLTQDEQKMPQHCYPSSTRRHQRIQQRLFDCENPPTPLSGGSSHSLSSLPRRSNSSASLSSTATSSTKKSSIESPHHYGSTIFLGLIGFLFCFQPTWGIRFLMSLLSLGEDQFLENSVEEDALTQLSLAGFASIPCLIPLLHGFLCLSTTLSIMKPSKRRELEQTLLGIKLASLYGMTLLTLYMAVSCTTTMSAPSQLLYVIAAGLAVCTVSVALPWMQLGERLAKRRRHRLRKQPQQPSRQQFSLETYAWIGCASLLPFCMLCLFSPQRLLSPESAFSLVMNGDDSNGEGTVLNTLQKIALRAFGVSQLVHIFLLSELVDSCAYKQHLLGWMHLLVMAGPLPVLLQGAYWNDDLNASNWLVLFVLQVGVVLWTLYHFAKQSWHFMTC